jgi:putative SOS response-associated peptidase YedK
MCGRYRLSRKKQIIEEYFDCVSGEEDWIPRHNIAPTQPVSVVRQNPKNNVRELSLMRWGLIPHWAKDSSIGMSTINAKAETAATKPAFRDPLRFRRCLIPADGFYEWVRHEVACVTVRRDHSFGPVVPSAVPYEVGRLGNEWSKSPRTM